MMTKESSGRGLIATSTARPRFGESLGVWFCPFPNFLFCPYFVPAPAERSILSHLIKLVHRNDASQHQEPLSLLKAPKVTHLCLHQHRRPFRIPVVGNT